MNKRLSNVRTRQQAGFEYAVNSLEPATPFGKKRQKEIHPFFPGEEEALRGELDKLERTVGFLKGSPVDAGELALIFMDMRECEGTIDRSRDCTLSTVELFEMKVMLIKMEQIRKLLQGREDIPQEFVPLSTETLLDILDPRGDRMSTFYIYEEFSRELARLREEKRNGELLLRKGMKERKTRLQKEKGINLSPKFDCRVSKSDEAELEKLIKTDELEQAEQDAMWITFRLKTTEAEAAYEREMEEIAEAIEDEEEKVREKLSRDIWKYSEELYENCNRIGNLDFTMAKADFAVKKKCIRPEICEEHIVHIKDGRQLQAEEAVTKKGGTYIPVSIELKPGVTCVTGANMGGKTVSLRMMAQTVLMAQYGFFVPCADAKLGLSSYMQMLVGDSQSLERGLSSFGSEMEELKEIFDNCKDRSLILVDEIASGTNPAEGTALTRAIIDYLKTKEYITVITTHFDVEGKGVNRVRAVGLENADFRKIADEIRYANRKERIQIIGKYMDYRLVPAGDGGIPRDALNIAGMLGIDKEIIKRAGKYLEGEDE